MQNALSLWRLIQNWHSLRKSEKPLLVGGIVAKSDTDELVIEGQGVRLVLKLAQPLPVTLGASVSFLCKPQNLQVDPQLSSISATAYEDFRVLAEPNAEKQLEFSFKTAQAWGDFLHKIRTYLRQNQLLEVQTPSLVQNSGMEPHLEPFVTTWKIGSQSIDLPLPTSPELHLKKLLCHGFTDIYEIKTCYRNQEFTEIHEPEFTMLEWYRAFSDIKLIEEDLKGLLCSLKPSVSVRVTSFKELFQTHFGFELRPATSFSELQKLAAEHELDLTAAKDFDDAFNLIVAFAIEPKLNPKEATIIYGFPPSQAALARIGEDGFAQRFELYWQGLEIANAFDELTDAGLQRQRHLRDQQLRQQLGRTHLPLDEAFLKSLEKGLPPSGGIAVGLDRLFMAVYGISSIEKTRAFSAKHHLLKE